METKHCNTCKTDKDNSEFIIGDKCYKQCGDCIKKRSFSGGNIPWNTAVKYVTKREGSLNP